MKMFINSKVYVQIKDLLFIMHILPKMDIECPKTVLVRLVDIGSKNKYDFIDFETKDEIDYFKKLDFIISYKDYKDLSQEKMNKCIENIGNELNILADKYHDLSEEEQSKKYDKYTTIFEKKYYEMESIRELYKIKIGELKIELPKEEGILNKIFRIIHRKD